LVIPVPKESDRKKSHLPITFVAGLASVAIIKADFTQQRRAVTWKPVVERADVD